MGNLAGVKLDLKMNTALIAQAVESELDGAMFEGGVVVADAIEARARPISTHVADRVYVVSRTRSKGKPHKKYAGWAKKAGGVFVGSSSGLSHLIELGVGPHVIKGELKMPDGSVVPKAEHPGHAARPFIRPALDESAEEAEEVSSAYLREKLEKRAGLNQ